VISPGEIKTELKNNGQLPVLNHRRFIDGDNLLHSKSGSYLNLCKYSSQWLNIAAFQLCESSFQIRFLHWYCITVGFHNLLLVNSSYIAMYVKLLNTHSSDLLDAEIT